MKIYFDVCCLSRLFDDLTNARNKLEADAIVIILEKCLIGDWELVTSEIIQYEIFRIFDKEKKEAVLQLQKEHKFYIKLTDEIIQRAKEFENNNIKPFDALHLASAENKKVDFFLTTDDDLLKKAGKIKLNFKIVNPLNFVIEVLING